MNGMIRKLALVTTLVGGVALAQSTSNPTPPPPGSPTGTDSRSGYPDPGSADPGQGSTAPQKMERSSQSSTGQPGYGGSGDAGTPAKKGKKSEGSSSDSSGK
jgi:hypothetical protein